MIRKVSTLVGAAMVSAAALAATEMTSESTFVYVRPETSSFWNTVTNGTVTVPIDFPAGASSAALTVSAPSYRRDYTGIVTTEFTFELPQPTSRSTENVYDLKLTFDDGTERTARLGCVTGAACGNEGSTRCLVPAGDRAWAAVKNRAVLPIPYGMTSFTVNGVETDTGLNGAQGWYALTSEIGESYSLTMQASGSTYLASLFGKSIGFAFLCK